MRRQNGRTLHDHLTGCLNRAIIELDQIDADTLLSENEDVLVAELLDKHMPRSIEIDWDGVTGSPTTEVKKEERDPFRPNQTYKVAASKMTLSVPYIGSKSILDYNASTFNYDSNEWALDDEVIRFDVVEYSLTTEAVQSRIKNVQARLDKKVVWANGDLARFLPNAEERTRGRLKQRRERILNDRKVEDSLGIPIVSTGVPRRPVRAQPKYVSLDRRRSSSRFVPEPELDEAIYREVVEQVQAWARSLERTPGTVKKLGEEGLRDLLLGTLNTYWQGAAGAELFNGAGKTDILVRADDRNVFIGELKIWRGAKTVHSTIDQLLSYMVWRDSKGAIVMFIRNANPTAIIEKLHQEVEKHPRFVLAKSGGDPKTMKEYIFTADEEGRRVSLAVIPVVLPAD